MINVLHVMGCADVGGISSVVINYYRHLDKNRIHFDVALTVDTIGMNGKELQKLGVEFFLIPMKSKSISTYCENLRAILQKKHYDAIHVHENETSYVALKVAKEMGVACRVAHSHTSLPYSGIKSELRRLVGIVLNGYYATHLIGCGKLAGDRVFGKINMKSSKGMVLPNAIDTRRFRYSEEERKSIRADMQLENAYVIGMVGRVSPEKNTVYALELFDAVKQIIPNVVLVIVGTGPDEEKLLHRINSHGLTLDVKFLGRRSDVERLYQAFDLFWMPSLHEGFPVAAVEAMASGLPIVLSDTITRELDFGEKIHYLPIKDKKRWAEVSSNCLLNDKRMQADEIKMHSLDIKEAAKKLECVYVNKHES